MSTKNISLKNEDYNLNINYINLSKFDKEKNIVIPNKKYIMKNSNQIIKIILALIVSCTACKTSIKQEQEAVMNFITYNYPDALNKQDTAAYAALFCNDVIWASPNALTAKTKAEIKKRIQSRIEKFEMKIVTRPYEVKVIDNFAYVIGEADLQLIPKDSSQTKNAYFTAIWLLKKQKNEWRISRLLFNNR